MRRYYDPRALFALVWVIRLLILGLIVCCLIFPWATHDIHADLVSSPVPSTPSVTPEPPSVPPTSSPTPIQETTISPTSMRSMTDAPTSYPTLPPWSRHRESADDLPSWDMSADRLPQRRSHPRSSLSTSSTLPYENPLKSESTVENNLESVEEGSSGEGEESKARSVQPPPGVRSEMIHSKVSYYAYKYCVKGSAALLGEHGCTWYYTKVPNDTAWVVLVSGAVLLVVGGSLLLYLTAFPGLSGLFDPDLRTHLATNFLFCNALGIGKSTNNLLRGFLVVSCLVATLVGLFVPPVVPHPHEGVQALRHTVEASYGIFFLTATVIAVLLEGVIDSDIRRRVSEESPEGEESLISHSVEV